MSKQKVLTHDEFVRFVPPKRTTQYIEELRSKFGLAPEHMNILDWGCGRGLETLWFRERGYNAFGVDIDPIPLNNGRPLFMKLGHPAECLRQLGLDSPFPDNFFHATFSNQVFEHVRDLREISEEFWRLTKQGGRGYHVFPAHKYITEGHLFMPFVHWLPKNRLRSIGITAYTLMGKEPRWSELEGLSRFEKAKRYCDYSMRNTFYRRPRDIVQTFEECGFEARILTIEHPRVQGHTLLGPLSRSRYSRPFVNFLLVNFVSNELELSKPAEQ